MSSEFDERGLFAAERLFLQLLEAFPTYVAEFEAKWKSWLQVILPAPSTWSSVPEFDALVALGPKVLPAVLWKMGMYNGENDMAVHLYNKLEKDPECLVNEGDLTNQVKGILEANFKRNRRIRNALLDWTEYCEMGLVQSSSSMGFTRGEEYDELIDLGHSIIPQFMLQYKKRVSPVYSYELLHQVLWGYRTGQMLISLEMQYNMWSEWFEKQNYDRAPHYRPQEDSVWYKSELAGTSGLLANEEGA